MDPTLHPLDPVVLGEPMAADLTVRLMSGPPTPNRNGWRASFVALFVAAAIVGLPATAHAHAAIVSSQPEPGQELGSAPGVVVLAFSEPLNVSLSRATVIDPSGRRFEGDSTGEREIRIPLTTNALGVYEVEWVTVSTLDGHTLRGSFRFGVGVDPGPGSEGAIGTDPQRSDLIVAIFRALEYVSLLLAIGMLLLLRLARSAGLEWVRPRVGWALGAAFASGLIVVVGEAVSAAGSIRSGAIVGYLTTGPSGAARTIRLLAEALSIVGWRIRRGHGLFLLVAIVALSASGHAAAVAFGVPVDAMHLVVAGLWTGGILALATLRPPDGWRGPQGRALLDGFSAVAIPAFVATLATGSLRGIQELSRPADLVQTTYGLLLSLKVLIVLCMVPLSILMWRRVLGSPRFEAGVAVLVIGVAALLAAFPLPPGRASEAEEGEEPSAAAVALPREGDLTLGGDAGEVLVGLTIRPARPGTNDVYVYLLPLEGEEAAAGVPATIELGGRTTSMEECGTTCRRAELELEGGERLAVDVETGIGGTASFELPSLPAPDGSRLLERVQQRMHQLGSYRQIEVLSSGRGGTRSVYAFVAPDRYTSQGIRDGEVTVEVIEIDDTRYFRSSPEAPWEEQTGGPVPEVPKFIWDYYLPAVGLSIVGSARVDGVNTEVVSFAGTGSVPIWFKLWVDDEGLVRRAEMRAQGHFMDHRYFAFDAPIEIEPPPDR
jgi:copper transport protein